jgi:hypothetical protein
VEKFEHIVAIQLQPADWQSDIPSTETVFFLERILKIIFIEIPPLAVDEFLVSNPRSLETKMKQSNTAGKLTAGLLLSVAVICPALRAEDLTRRVSEDEAKKAITTKTTPEYPPMARQMKLGGKVQVDAYIDTEGGEGAGSDR